MDFKKLGNALTVIGAIVLLIAVAWWLYFYNSLMKDFARLTGSRPDAGLSDAFDLSQQRRRLGFFCFVQRELDRRGAAIQNQNRQRRHGTSLTVKRCDNG